MSDSAPAPTPAPSPAPTPAPSPAPAPAAAAWHGIPDTDADGIAYIGTKGWKGPQDVITSYRNAEKLIGRDPSTLLTLPRADDPAAFLDVMGKLGRPADAKDYKFAEPQGGLKADDGYLTWARGTFHELGFTAAQVEKLSAKHNEYVAGVLKQQEADYNLSVQGERSALQTEWGGGYDRMMASAKHAASTLGFTPDMIDAIERTVGYASTMKHFAELGKKLGEAKFVSPDSGRPGFEGMMTPAEAKQEWETMKTDPVWGKALTDPTHPNNKAAKEKQTKLFKIMYPEG